MQTERLHRFKDDSRFAGLRQTGTITALELDVPAGGYLSDAGPKLRTFFKQNGVLLRPLGNVIYVMPPYCVTAEELDRTYDVITQGVDMIAGQTR